MVKVNSKDWLIIVDYQNDFLPPDGALAVPDGDKLVDPINELIDKFPNSLATRDWHPEDHYSFEKNGGSWPGHCVQGTRGAKFHPDLKTENIDFELKKGFDPRDRSDYSGFSGRNPEDKKMTDILQEAEAEGLFVVGLALDYCVRETALDGLEKDFDVFLLEDCTEPVDEEDGKEALTKIKENGGKVILAENLKF